MARLEITEQSGHILRRFVSFLYCLFVMRKRRECERDEARVGEERGELSTFEIAS